VGYYILCKEEWSESIIPNGSYGNGGDDNGSNKDGSDCGNGDGDGGNGSAWKKGGGKRVYSMKNILHSVNCYYIWWYIVTLP